MKVSNERFEELCAAKVLGAFSPQEEKEFQSAMGQATKEQKQFFHELHWASQHIPALAVVEGPRENLRESLVRKVEKPSLNQKIRSFFTLPNLSYALSFGLLFAGFFLYQGQVNLKEELRANTKYTQSLKNYIDENRAYFAFLESAKLKTISLKAKEGYRGEGQVLWDQETGRALVDLKGLPKAPKDKEYQLWVISGGKPVSMGIFKEKAFFKVNTSQAELFAVTLEPKGGRSQPTGPMYLAGQI